MDVHVKVSMLSIFRPAKDFTRGQKLPGSIQINKFIRIFSWKSLNAHYVAISTSPGTKKPLMDAVDLVFRVRIYPQMWWSRPVLGIAWAMRPKSALRAKGALI